MKKRDRLLALLLIILLVLPAIPLQVSANSPPPSPYYIFRISNFPKGTVYVDLLIPLTESDERYVATIKENLPESFSEDAEILSYMEDGYCSYTFHYQDALSTLSFDQDNNVYFFADTTAYIMSDEDIRYEHADEIYALGSIRLALLDEHGDILRVSPVLELTLKDFFASLENVFYYDALAEEFEVVYQDSTGGHILYGMLCFFGVLFTRMVELFTAVPFGLYKDHKKQIVLINVISQIIMYTAYVMLYSVVFWKYESVVILLEILVYTGEGIWYSRNIRSVSHKRILAYTVTANTVSLILGKYLIYRMLI